MNMKIEFHYPCDKIEGGGISSLKLTQFSWLLLHRLLGASGETGVISGGNGTGKDDDV